MSLENRGSFRACARRRDRAPRTRRDRPRGAPVAQDSARGGSQRTETGRPGCRRPIRPMRSDPRSVGAVVSCPCCRPPGTSGVSVSHGRAARAPEIGCTRCSSVNRRRARRRMPGWRGTVRRTGTSTTTRACGRGDPVLRRLRRSARGPAGRVEPDRARPGRHRDRDPCRTSAIRTVRWRGPHSWWSSPTRKPLRSCSPADGHQRCQLGRRPCANGHAWSCVTRTRRPATMSNGYAPSASAIGRSSRRPR